MQIKNIQQFRTNWRNAQGYDMPNWDENFIGSGHNENSGFYKMVNGIVENIKADLTPKLQNAQDEQAIYEFLQNAADSQSTECAVIYDETFFMVLNNGRAFSEKDLKALLNSFQGTKADKTKVENCGKIGRYGIGFKLAYRLMGKSDGAEELLRDLAGPLLFSWYNNKQFADLMNYDGGSLNLENSIEADTAPWLLKIILACFPTSPEESVKNLDYKDQVLFNQEELGDLVAFLNKNKELLQQFSLEQGSLFFLRFGPKKHEKLKESLLNITSGIGYAMNNLKTLEKVALQEDIIEKFETKFERYSILPGTEDFKNIDPEFPTCPIEISLGFPASLEQMQALKEAPSLYQFFPMRNERHGMAYFVHSSSFAKITDRTRLDDQGEANIETFKYIAKSLKRNLDKYKQENLETYCHIYKALLLTDRSTEYDAELINKHLYDPLLEYIQMNIPTNKGNFYLKDLIIAKGTALPIEPMSLGIGREWLYWTDIKEENDILRSAANNAKLGLKRWGIKELIMEANLSLLNNFIAQLSPEDYQVFVAELKRVDFDEAFLEKFGNIKCFKFTSTTGAAHFYAIDDLQGQEDIFLMSEHILPIRDSIKGLGFSVLEFNILDYAVILQQLESQLDYLTNDEALFKKITARTNNATLSVEQKHNLYSFLMSLDGVKKEALRGVHLFYNKEGLPAPLYGLLPADANVEYWLENFKIAEEEDSEVLAEQYISKKNQWELYTHIIVPFWEELVKGIDGEDEESLVAFYTSVANYFKLKSNQPKLDEANYIYTNSEHGFCTAQTVFYHRCLGQIEVDYPALRSAVSKVLNLVLPHPSILPFLEADPFRTSPTTASKEWKKGLNGLIERCKTTDLNPEEKKAFFVLLTGILSAKELARIELFRNQKGEHMVLSKLIASTKSVENWLNDYRIDEKEDDVLLQNYLAKETDIYNNILVAEWKAVTTHNSIAANIKSFYQGVLKYASLAKSPKPLITSKYIFVDTSIGFVGSGQIFFHNQMIETEKYGPLRTAINTLTDCYTPHPDVLPFLIEGVFKTRNSILSKSIAKDVVVLEKGEAASLVHFFEKTKEDLFTFLYLTESPENSRECEVGKRARNIPYAVEKGQQGLAEKINAIFGDTYKLVPAKIYQPDYRNKGLLRGSQLFNAISKSKEVSPELLSALIVESGNADVQEQVFSKIDKIVLKEGQTYNKDSFEHQTLQIFRNKEADHSKVRSKIYIENLEGELFKLNDIGFDDAITISIERSGKFNLKLSEVLPRFKVIQALLQNIANQFVDYEAPTVLQRRCFEGEEKLVKDIFDELKANHPVLENAYQLAFALLYAKDNDNSKIIKSFLLHTQAAEPIEISTFDAFHLNNNSFIDSSAILNSQYYAGVDELLRIQEKETAFSFGSQNLVYGPYIDKNTFYCAPIRTLEEKEKPEQLQSELLNFLYEIWSEIPDLERPTQLELKTNTENSLGGLLPAELVYPEEYALVKERFPDWLMNWVGEEEELVEERTIQPDYEEPIPVDGEEVEEFVPPSPKVVLIPRGKLSLLNAIGVNTERSTLVGVRQYFHTNIGEPVSQKQLNDLRNSEQDYLLQTILWLQSEGTVFTSEDERLYWLRKLYNTLPKLTQNTPLPYIIKVGGIEEEPTFEYKVDNHADQELYYFDQKQQKQLFEKFEISIAHVFDCLTAAGQYLTNLDIKGIEFKTTKVENKLDLERLEANSQEWGADHYMKWREDAEYSIYLYDGKMPYVVYFLDQVVKEYEHENAVLCNKIAYVNSNSTNIEEDLFSITKYNTLTEAHLLGLLRFKNEDKKETSAHKVIERVVETVVVEEKLAENEEAIENPSVEDIQVYKDQNVKGKLKLAFDISELPAEMLEELLQYAKSSKMIIEKKEVDKG
ncbi:sacsin N-terminal ATP-binding-like domain-containing protein [Aureispira sp. CCB-QB1]|uniref:sacsin N-terminal ATP-binding-like domain-containing protein n=1 Tax=Aureispira sp. CCB-QB1 TaxID=1313421 RepID=UPI0006981FB9|nr:ATP-binding protein [Aureispira sp. CCB-QB1]